MSANLNPTGQSQNPFPFMPLNPASSPSGQAPTSYSTSWGGPPPAGSPGNYNFGNSQNPNPSGAGFTGAPTVSMNPGQTTAFGSSPTTGNAFNLTGRQDQRTLGELQKYYGEGVGSLLYQYLQSGGGFNSSITQQAVDSQVADMQQQIQRGLSNLDTQMGETGISPNSSAWALETGDYETQAVKDENAIISQEFFNMWNQSQNRELSVLQDVAGVNATGTANEPGVMDFLNMGLQAAGTAAMFL